MSYIFKPIKRKIYSKTFLKDVHLCLEFGKEGVLNSEVCSFLQERFGVNYDSSKSYKEISVHSEDGLVGFVFSASSLEIALKHPAYKKFDFALEWLKLMTDYCELLDVTVVKKLTISKYNELAYSIPNSSLGVEVIMQEVFSSAMLNLQNDSDNILEQEKSNFPSMSRWERFGTFDGDDELNSMFSYEFGFCRKANEPLKGALTLKTCIESRDVEIPIYELKNNMLYFNDILDQGFHWCVTDSIINKME